MKLSVPDEIGLAHLDITEKLAGWSGMKQNSEMIGSAAVDIVVGQLHRNETGIPKSPKCVQIGSTWVEGTTLQEVSADRAPSKKV